MQVQHRVHGLIGKIIHSEGMHGYCEAPQRHHAKGLQSHQCRTQSPRKEKEALD